MAIETRKITLTCELPEVVVQALEEKARENGHSLKDELVKYLAKELPKQPELSPEEAERRRRAFERHFGEVSSGDPNSSDNERIDADLASAYADDHEGKGD